MGGDRGGGPRACRRKPHVSQMSSQDQFPEPDERSVFLGAIDLPAGTARTKWVAEACGNDLELLQRVEALLEAHDGMVDGFLEFPARRPETGRGNGEAAPPCRGEEGEQEGDVVGEYELLAREEETGCAVIFEARKWRPAERKVRLTVLRSPLDCRPVFERFQARKPAFDRLRHRGIARVLDVGMTDRGRLYVAEEFVPGIPLAESCETMESAVEQRLRLFRKLCDVMAFAHEQGWCHGNLSESSIRVVTDEEKGRPVVTGFGLALVPPERGGEADSRLPVEEGALVEATGFERDIADLGALFPRLVPELFSRRVEVLMALQTGWELGPRMVPRLLRGEFHRIVRRTSLQTNSAERYGTVRELVGDLTRVLPRRLRARAPVGRTARQ